MIYTNIPLEMIFYSEAPITKILRAEYLGAEVLLSESSEGEYKIDRLISTNPQFFLQEELSPGKIVKRKDIKNI